MVEPQSIALPGTDQATIDDEAATRAVVDRIAPLADGVLEIGFIRPAGELWPAWKPGAHVDVVLPNGMVRQYSLCGGLRDRSTLRLGVLREANGRGGSAWIHDELKVGDRLDVRGPRNHFELADHDRYIFIAGGIGITPILAMLQHVQDAGKSWAMHYGGRTRASMAFLEELEALGGDVHVYPDDEVGLLPLPEILGEPCPTTGVYACGPGPMLDAVDRYRSDWPPHAIHMERFVPKPIAHTNDQPIEVHLARERLTIDVPPDESILQAVTRAGVRVISSCTEGTCGTCETTVLEGMPDHRDSVLDEEEKANADCMMICVSRALSRRLVLDL